MQRSRSRGDRGAVTAEFVVVLPAVLLVFTLVIGAVVLSTQQLTLTSAAGDLARLEARGDAAAAADRRGRLPMTTSAVRRTHGSLVCVELSAHPGPGVLAALEIRATGCAARTAESSPAIETGPREQR